MHGFIRAILLLLTATLVASAQGLPDEHPNYIEGCNWVLSPRIKVNALVPIGWVYQDFSREHNERTEIYITPKGVPPFNSAYRFSVFGGVRVNKLLSLVSSKSKSSFTTVMLAKRKSIQKMIHNNPKWLANPKSFNVGDFEYFQYEYTSTNSQVPGKKLLVTVFNFATHSCYEITAELPDENTSDTNDTILKIVHLLQFPAE